MEDGRMEEKLKEGEGRVMTGRKERKCRKGEGRSK